MWPGYPTPGYHILFAICPERKSFIVNELRAILPPFSCPESGFRFTYYDNAASQFSIWGVENQNKVL
jgi:hypothetical protein